MILKTRLASNDIVHTQTHTHTYIYVTQYEIWGHAACMTKYLFITSRSVDVVQLFDEFTLNRLQIAYTHTHVYIFIKNETVRFYIFA